MIFWKFLVVQPAFMRLLSWFQMVTGAHKWGHIVSIYLSAYLCCRKKLFPFEALTANVIFEVSVERSVLYFCILNMVHVDFVPFTRKNKKVRSIIFF